MTQAERDHLVALRKAKKKLITQRQAAEEIGVTERQVRRLLRKLRRKGDRAVIHELRGRASNRKLPTEMEQRAITVLSDPVYRGFGPTLAAEYLHNLHEITVSKETLRRWMAEAGLWKAGRRRVVEVHQWRSRRSRFGELVQWDTSTHDWLEGRGERLYLIAMIDDATSRLFARFVRHDTSEENMKLLWSYLEKFGRPVAFYMDKASMFQTAEKRKKDEPGVDKDPVEMPPTQIGRGLRELGITWIAAHSPQAKGRVERNFQTAQDRLVKGMRVAGVKTLEEANQYLKQDYMVWWERELTVEPSNPDDAHRPLDKSHNLAASLSHVETRQVGNNYTIRFDAELYQTDRAAIVSGLRRANVRVEKRLDGSLAVRYGERYLPVQLCEVAERPKASPAVKAAKPRRTGQRGSDWGKNFDLKKGPKVWQVAAESGRRKGPTE